MASQADIARLRAANADLSTLVVRDLRSFWGSLDLSKPESARNALLKFVPVLVGEYGDIAATVSSDWYDEMRAKAGVPGRFAALPADVAPLDVTESRVRYGAGDLFTDNPAGTLDFLEGATVRSALQAGRDTIVGATRKDPRSSGWYRVSGGGCDFCAMLADRGAVYKEDTADFAAHDHCRCASVPSWDASRPEADVKQYVASERTSNMTAAQKEAHNARIRDYLAQQRGDTATSSGKSAATTAARVVNVDATRTTAQLRDTLSQLETSAAKFSSAGTRARLEELRQEIAAR